jgi:lysophospholipase L1-like esterase
MPRVMERESEQEIAELEEMARAAGFEIMSLADTFTGQNVEALHLAPWDFHPNRAGHALLGERLYEQIAESGILPALDARSEVGS